MTYLQELQDLIGKINEDHGFNEYAGTPDEYKSLYIGNKLMLMVSELSEAQDEIRTGQDPKTTYYPVNPPLALVAEVGDVAKAEAAYAAYLAEKGGPPKPEGLPSELADSVIRAFSLAFEIGIDLGASIQEKLVYNETRPFRHGKKF